MVLIDTPGRENGRVLRVGEQLLKETILYVPLSDLPYRHHELQKLKLIEMFLGPSDDSG